MKRLLCALLLWTLLAGLALPQGAAEDALRAAAESGAALRLEEAPLGELLKADCPVYVPASFLQEYPDALDGLTVQGYSLDGLRARVGTLDALGVTVDQLRLADVSPDGALVFTRDQTDVLVYRDGEATLVLPTSRRGVADVYGNFARWDAQLYANKVGTRGLVWSPDGRWAALTNAERALRQGQFFHDLILLDTHTGELILAETTPDKLMQGAANVVHACFDDTGDTLYYTMFGSIYPFRCSLMACDMNTLETRLLRNHAEFIYRQGLYLDANGDLVCPEDSADVSRVTSLLVYTRYRDRWLTQRLGTGVTMGRMTMRQLQLSRESGYGVILYETREPQAPLLSVVNAIDQYAARYDAVLLPAAGGAAQRVTLRDALDAGAAAPSRAEGDNAAGKTDAHSAFWAFLGDYCLPRACALSPDGLWALILYNTQAENQPRYGLLSLAFYPVDAPEAARSVAAYYDTPLSMAFPRGVAWLAHDKIIIGGCASAYRLVFE